jgi:hypothetical protein
MRSSQAHRNYLEDGEGDGFLRCLSLYVFLILYKEGKIWAVRVTQVVEIEE